MAVGQTAYSDLNANDAVNFIRDELLDIAEKTVTFMPHATKINLPQHESQTVQVVRYKRIPLPQTPATEGVTPSSTKLENEKVNATIDQWILIVELTDLAQLTIKHPLVPIVTDRLGTAQGELVDREIQKVLLSGTTVQFAGGNTSRGALAATDVVNSVEVNKIWRTLKRNGARFRGPHYMLIVDPEQSQDISDEDKFRAAHQFRDTMALFNNEIGVWRGFRVMVSNLIPIIDPIADADWTAALVGTGGPYANTDVVRVKITAVDDVLGFEEDVSQVKSLTITASDENVDVTMPSTSGFTYNVYVSDADASNTLRLQTSGQAPSAVFRTTGFQATGTIAPASTAVGVSVHTAYAFGRDAYAALKLSGDNLRVLMTDGKPSDSDPAAQRKKISLKGSFKVFILDQSWLVRLESGSAY